MTDRELLEAAAKAAGISLTPVEIKNVTRQGDDRFIGYRADYEQWQRGWFNPLTDDGDALRLAVKLRIDVRPNSYDTMCYGPDPKRHRTVAETHGNDPYAATRRAIVRAAAQIGAGMIHSSTAVHP